jgi:DNA-directed RNA polymerase specialized sigma24 family protein
MDRIPAPKREWVLTPEAFDRLLAWLDADRERAGEEYEQIRQRLMRFFKWRGCALPEEYTDITIDRVIKRINEGVDLRVADPYLYFHGVALKVLKEHWKEAERGVETLAELPVAQFPTHSPIESREHELEKIDHERRLDCLEDCLQKLPADSLALLTQYHQGERRTKIENRNQLSKRLNIPLNTLRIRAFRIRSELAKCIERCLKRKKI